MKEKKTSFVVSIKIYRWLALTSISVSCFLHERTVAPNKEEPEDNKKSACLAVYHKYAFFFLVPIPHGEKAHRLAVVHII